MPVLTSRGHVMRIRDAAIHCRGFDRDASRFHKRYVHGQCCLCEVLSKLDLEPGHVDLSHIFVQELVRIEFEHVMALTAHKPECPWPGEYSCYRRRKLTLGPCA